MMKHDPYSKMPDEDLKLLAKMITVSCVRNTVIETYHAQGKLTDPEMKAFNIQVINRVYTFLNAYFNMTEDHMKIFEHMTFVAIGSTHNWNEPILDEGMFKVFKPL